MTLWPSFILDLANNHNGSIDFALKAIRAHAEVVNDQGVSAAIKFQWRDHEFFRHGDETYQAKFRATELNDYSYLCREVRQLGLQVAATAFDRNAATDLHMADIAKVASCSAKDWSTIEAIRMERRPIIYSAGGLNLSDVDRLIFSASGKFALMHCVSLYPTQLQDCNLHKIGIYKRRYPGVPIGWSTHEEPNETLPIQMAVGYGAEIFERHIGLPGCNAYSSTPAQLDKWITAWKVANIVSRGRYTADDERAALARVSRQDVSDAEGSPYSSGGGLESGAVSPSWAGQL